MSRQEHAPFRSRVRCGREVTRQRRMQGCRTDSLQTELSLLCRQVGPWDSHAWFQCPRGYLERLRRRQIVASTGSQRDGPAVNARMIHRYAAFGCHFFHRPQAQRVGQLPAHPNQDHLNRRVPPHENPAQRSFTVFCSVPIVQAWHGYRIAAKSAKIPCAKDTQVAGLSAVPMINPSASIGGLFHRTFPILLFPLRNTTSYT